VDDLVCQILIVDEFEVRDLKRANRVNHESHDVLGLGDLLLTEQSAACPPKDTKHLCSVEPLAFTVFAKTHGNLVPSRPRKL
jgi:hypothetical protein